MPVIAKIKSNPKKTLMEDDDGDIPIKKNKRATLMGDDDDDDDDIGMKTKKNKMTLMDSSDDGTKFLFFMILFRTTLKKIDYKTILTTS